MNPYSRDPYSGPPPRDQDRFELWVTVVGGLIAFIALMVFLGWW